MNNLKSTDTSPSQQPFVTSSMQLPYHYFGFPHQTLTAPCASIPSPFFNTTPLYHQQHHSQSYQHQLQTLSKDEWDLVLSYRMMKNLNIAPQIRPPPSLSHQHTTGTTSHQSNCFSNLNEQQIYSTTYDETGTQPIHLYTAVPAAAFSFHSHTPTSTQQFLCSSPNECENIERKQVLKTVDPSCPTISTQQTTDHLFPLVQSHPIQQTSSPTQPNEQNFSNTIHQQSHPIQQTSSSSPTETSN